MCKVGHDIGLARSDIVSDMDNVCPEICSGGTDIGTDVDHVVPDIDLSRTDIGRHGTSAGGTFARAIPDLVAMSVPLSADMEPMSTDIDTDMAAEPGMPRADAPCRPTSVPTWIQPCRFHVG